MTRRAFAYVRTAGDGTDEHTADEQRSLIEGICQVCDLSVVEWVDERTGDVPSPGLLRLLSRLKRREADVVVVASIDRALSSPEAHEGSGDVLSCFVAALGGDGAAAMPRFVMRTALTAHRFHRERSVELRERLATIAAAGRLMLESRDDPHADTAGMTLGGDPELADLGIRCLKCGTAIAEHPLRDVVPNDDPPELCAGCFACVVERKHGPWCGCLHVAGARYH